MKALMQENPGGEIFLAEVPIPEPGPGEVLIKMKFSPINYSDLSLLQGTHAPRPQYPVIPGIEGSGIVVQSGKGLIPALRKGKRVACTASENKGGTWAEFMVTSATRTIPLNKKLDDEQGAMLLVNPLTALSLIEIPLKNKQRAIVNNAAIRILMKQSPSAIDQLADVFYLSDGEKNLLLSSNIGEGIFFAGKSHVAMQVVASMDEHALITTNPAELRAMSALAGPDWIR